MQDILAVIPARGGSKGIKDKYINELIKLNYLCVSLFPGEELKSLLKKNPVVVKAFPLLLAVMAISTVVIRGLHCHKVLLYRTDSASNSVHIKSIF